MSDADGARPGPLRVLAYSENDGVGGAEVSLANLVNALNDSVSVTLMGVEASVVEWFAAQCPSLRETRLLRRVESKRHLSAILSHVQEIRALQPDILHVNLQHPWSGQYAILAGALTPGCRTVAVEHCPAPASGPLQRRLRPLVLSRIDAHVAVGERSARLVEELTGAKPGSIEVIPNGAPEVDLEPVPHRSSAPVLGFLGRLSTEEKGLDVLLAALAELPEPRLVLVGDGPDREPLERTVRELGLSGRVSFTGWRAEPRRHLASFDLLVLPSRIEGLPLSIIEAMQAGLAVVASDVGSVPELVVPESTGLLVPPGDRAALSAALRRLLDDRDLRGRMGAEGRRIAHERHTARRMAEAFKRVYERLHADGREPVRA